MVPKVSFSQGSCLNMRKVGIEKWPYACPKLIFTQYDQNFMAKGFIKKITCSLQKVSKGCDVFFVIATDVCCHAFLDGWRNAQKDRQGDQVGD